MIVRGAASIRGELRSVRLTTVQTRSHQIAGVEKFEILIKRDGAIVDIKTNGLMGPYGWNKALKGSKTVNQWKSDRFRPSYPGLDCDVLYDDGTVAAPQTLLSTVRETYEED
jgi:hypothetical protein